MIAGCQCHSTCGDCGFYDSPSNADDCVTCPQGSEIQAVYSDGTGYCNPSTTYDGPSEEPVWYEFIVNEEVDSFAVVMTYDETYENLYLWTANNDICALKLDYENA